MSSDDDALRETATYRLGTLTYDFANPTPEMQAELSRLSDESAAELRAAPAIKAAVDALMVEDRLARMERQAHITAGAQMAAERQAFAESPWGQILGAAALGVVVVAAWFLFFGGSGTNDDSRAARSARDASCKAGTLTDCPTHIMRRARRIADAIDDGEVRPSQLRRMAECEARWPSDAESRVICADLVLND